ncbi:hypothetical protein [Prosthecomicrobium hirschii]|uniref:hypothetical protein n=1 Tax=Prosthecodimorpha hirschii TaxID=665126 RepID=UPI0022202C9B|nr:hypothetical protein [Prosthecomicrobium hirschii]MCW1844225.1 hypothetical protein [Prosthecomicrobium hirschii]
MRQPAARTWEILREAEAAAKEAGTTPAVILAMAIEMLEQRAPNELRRADPRSRPLPTTDIGAS